MLPHTYDWVMPGQGAGNSGPNIAWTGLLPYFTSMSVAEIEAAIKTLPKEELVQFNQWYQAFLDERWDEEIRDDARAGKLNFLLEEVKAEREAGILRRWR